MPLFLPKTRPNTWRLGDSVWGDQPDIPGCTLRYLHPGANRFVGNMSKNPARSIREMPASDTFARCLDLDCSSEAYGVTTSRLADQVQIGMASISVEPFSENDRANS
jgi:hypothetical protein